MWSFKTDRVALFAAGSATLTSLTFGVTLGFVAPVFDTMRNDGGNLPDDHHLVVFDKDEATTFAAIVTLGAIIGSTICGPIIMETLGRRSALMLTSPLFMTAFMWPVFARDAMSLYIARVLSGIAHGIVNVANNAYICETAPLSLRGTLGALTQVTYAFGLFYAISLGMAFRTSEGVLQGIAVCQWRYLSLACAVPAALIGVTLFFAPESPRWLASKNRISEALAALSRLRGGQETVEETESLKKLVPDRSPGSPEKVPLKKRILRRASDCREASEQLTIGIILMFLVQASGLNVVTLYQINLMKSAGVSNPDLFATVAMVLNVVGSFSAIFVMDKLGRRLMLALGFGGTSVSLALLALVSAYPEAGAWLAVVAVNGFFLFFAFGVGDVPYILLAEIYPTNVMSFGMSVSVTGGLLTSLVMAKYTETWIDLTRKWFVFLCYALICLSGLVFTLVKVPETRGKTFQEIQNYFYRKNGNTPAGKRVET